jgi:hypothetical protein
MRTKQTIVIISAILFIIPFFWLKPGFVDFGGDAGRFYFLKPYEMLQTIYKQQTISGVSMYAYIPYLCFIYLVQQLIGSATYMIAFEHGLQLALAFGSMCLIIKELLILLCKKENSTIRWVSITSGLVYVGFIAKTGWVTSLPAQNQIFLNPLIFYLLLRFYVTSRYRYAIGIGALTLLYSVNFSYGNTPQLFAFYPLSLMFLFFLMRFVFRKQIPWKRLFMVFIVVLALHAFHLLPMIASLFDKGSELGANVFSSTYRQNGGVQYFDANRQEYGKLSTVLFQPLQDIQQGGLMLVIPLIVFLGFIVRKRIKLLAMTGFFFAATFFLVSANITIIGVKIYTRLFYIPGFIMFRSFYDKWYYVFVFFYALLFGISLYALLEKKKDIIIGLVSCFIIASVMYRISPFIQGNFYQDTHTQTKNIPLIYTLDPDLIDTLMVLKSYPDDGNVLTLPLTLPGYQMAFGKTNGAYVGISMVKFISGKKDYAGFWSFGPYQKSVQKVLEKGDMKQTLQLLSLLNIRYIFRNNDPRVIDAFPLYPNYRYVITTDIPAIDSQTSYDQLLGSFPLSERYKRGFFQIMELNSSIVRPTVYIADAVYASQDNVLTGPSFRSAYIDEVTCKEISSGEEFCNTTLDNKIPTLTFTRTSGWSYNFTLDVGKRIKPFLIVLLDDYHSSWTLKPNGVTTTQGLRHVVVNGYANGWIVDPMKLNISGITTGVIYLGFQKYYTIGWVISGIVGGFMMLTVLYCLVRKYGKKK